MAKKKPYISKPQAGLTPKQHAFIQEAHGKRLGKVASFVKSLSSRAVTSLPYDELSVAYGNFDASRLPIDHIIIHTMVGTWQSAAARFAQSGTQVSAHYGVTYDGKIKHWLEEYYTAYHAGNYYMNQRSIGIEHEDMGNYNSARPDVLYATSAKLVADICKFYNIPCDRQHIVSKDTILKHGEVSATACPDSLDIDRIVREAQAILTPLTDKQKLDKISVLVAGTGDVHKWQVRAILQS